MPLPRLAGRDEVTFPVFIYPFCRSFVNRATMSFCLLEKSAQSMSLWPALSSKYHGWVSPHVLASMSLRAEGVPEVLTQISWPSLDMAQSCQSLAALGL